MMGTETRDIRAVEDTSSRQEDSALLSDLSAQRALLRQSGLVLTVAFPVAVQATASISALARAEKRFMNEPCRAIGPSDNGE